MSRAPRHYEITPTVEPPPDWWAAEFHRRQAKCRRRILDRIARDGAQVASTLWDGLCGFTREEREHAAAALVAAGLVATELRSERHRFDAAYAKEYTYYALTAKGVKHANESR